MRRARRGAKLAGNLRLAQTAGLPAQHVHELGVGHVHLGAEGHEVAGEGGVVLAQQAEGQHVEVDVAEDEGAAAGVEVLVLDEVRGLVAPVAARVEVVGCVVAVVEGEAVALARVSGGGGGGVGGRGRDAPARR